MRHVTAIAVSVLLACLALAGTGDAQTAQPIQIQGTISSVDCQTGQVTLSTSGGSDTFQATDQTAAYVNGSAVSFCSLQSDTGDSATAVLVPTGNAFDLTQIDVTAQAAAPSAPSTSGSLLSNPVAIGVGALLLGGLIGYIVGHQNTQAQPVYSPYGYQYYSSGHAPSWLPTQYPYDQPYRYQGHRYYRCNNGWWNVDRACEVRER
ncbi:MAG TPA: hypothetical protein VJT33_10440 [bacterium]|nr:hypothetical protein [bacterium]